ncbi:choice-of-anchor W domain-containing protein [Haloarchaeobius baliensis]|uniref:choice-of-anchor W domain-containing protein n=1 Tax=Haloarchaeobius baliensis TaxID=1670458 RepID=UPI003F883039
MSDKNTLGLSRRRLLGGLGAIGVASAGAGLGTSAYFSDTESFTDNMMTAGSLDLKVDYVVHEDQGSAGSYTINSFTDTVNGSSADVPTLDGDGSTMSQDLDDIKPGDSGHSYFCFTIDTNPAYLWACGELTASNENGYTEPEPVDDNGEGELEEAIQATMSYCEVDDEGGLVSTGEEIFSGSLRELLDQLHGGIPLDGTGDSTAMPGGQAPFDGSGDDEVDNPCICIEWDVPTEVGNEIQTDGIEFDLSFYAIQSRHNDGSENPCLEGETGPGFSKERTDLEPTWNARGIIADNDDGTGDAGLAELDIRDASDNDLGDAGADYENGVAQDFEVSYNGGTASIELGDDSLSVSGPEPTDDDVAITVKTSNVDTSVSVENVQVNGASPSGATSVSAADGDRAYLFIAGGGIRDGDSITGEVTFSWTGDAPTGERLGFRVDA